MHGTIVPRIENEDEVASTEATASQGHEVEKRASRCTNRGFCGGKSDAQATGKMAIARELKVLDMRPAASEGIATASARLQLWTAMQEEGSRHEGPYRCRQA